MKNDEERKLQIKCVKWFRIQYSKLKVYNYENTNKLLWWETASC